VRCPSRNLHRRPCIDDLVRRSMRLNFLRPAGSSWLCLLLFLIAGPSAVGAGSLLNGLVAPAADPDRFGTVRLPCRRPSNQ
jgi:hypothetical protein